MRVRATEREGERMGIVKEAMADLILTSMWIFTMPVSRILTGILISGAGINPTSLSAIFANIFSASLLLIAFSLISGALGGASFNPATTVAFTSAGRQKSGYSLLSAAVRFPAQAAGGVAGVKAVLALVPKPYSERLRGPSLVTELHMGAFAEGALSLVFCFSVLFVVFKGPVNPVVKVWLMSCVTAGLVILGSGYSGPSLNPANAFGWAYSNNTHDTWQHYYVYWACPLIGALLGGWVFRTLFPNKPVVVTKEKKSS